MPSSIENYNDLDLLITVDGTEYIAKKAYVRMSYSGDYCTIRWADVEKGGSKYSFTLDYNDVTEPVSESGLDLFNNLQEFLFPTGIGATLPAGSKVYRTLLTQTGTSVPTRIGEQNDFAVLPSWAYSAAGTYTLTFDSALTVSKVRIIVRPSVSLKAGGWLSTTSIGGADKVVTLTTLSGGVATNGLLHKAAFDLIQFP